LVWPYNAGLHTFCSTQILRHSALEHGLAMRSDGFVLVDDIMQLQKKTRSGRALSSHSIEEVRQVWRCFDCSLSFLLCSFLNDALSSI
jgi:hypothetical protein